MFQYYGRVLFYKNAQRIRVPTRTLGIRVEEHSGICYHTGPWYSKTLTVTLAKAGEFYRDVCSEAMWSKMFIGVLVLIWILK